MTAEYVKETIFDLMQPERAELIARFFKTGPGQYGEGDQFLGLTMPQQREIARQFADLPFTEVEKLVKDQYHECRMVGLVIWVNQFRSRATSSYGKEAIYMGYLEHRAHINNWDLVDVTCPTIVGGYLLHNDRSVLYELAAEQSLWSQRMAIISTLTFIRKGQFGDTFALAEQLLSHQHDLIHKAIGWMLREAGKKDELALEEFLTDHIRQMPRTALRYAIERFDPKRRKAFLAM
ncbi:DNA alkylation repair protein [Arsenicibacter rosenii]|uniref:DNA alkylation repair protein n=1 Tax=Arsenicibacter rosenii TaxID=1750698 RepID=A0A1S2VHA0_9BACT|nr:DNA alkylation repair protein [Arsenicibacter rosenii]OIN57258.1 DNA alkylation repair protein [Arsenicibacter rosenii]